MTKFETILKLSEIKGELGLHTGTYHAYESLCMLIRELSEEFQSEDENCACKADYVCMACRADECQTTAGNCDHCGQFHD